MAVLLGQKIRYLRKNKGLTQFDLERKTGIKREYLSKIENDELNNPTFSTLVKICEGIGIPISELLVDDDSLPSRKDPVIKVLARPEEMDKINDKSGVQNFLAAPIISSEFAACNPKFIGLNDVEDYALIYAKYLEPTDDQHRYRCVVLDENDESMKPALEPGAIICIDSHRRDPVELDRKLVAMRDNNGKCVARRLRLERNYVLGMPENIKDYSPIVFSANKQARILGQIVWYQSPVRE